uniref:Uncharacterized protein n=1 Tax=Anopheles funestus TaxID=62324 RepID=A0A182S0Z6_ANOFN
MLFLIKIIRFIVIAIYFTVLIASTMGQTLDDTLPLPTFPVYDYHIEVCSMPGSHKCGHAIPTVLNSQHAPKPETKQHTLKGQ